MTQQFYAPWPYQHPFPGSQSSATGHGPDFPSDAGDRERGKFRPSSEPRLTTLAVVNDDGTQIGYAIAPQLDELTYLMRLVVQGLSYLTGEDLFADDNDPDY